MFISNFPFKNIILGFLLVFVIGCQKETSDTKDENAGVTELQIGTTHDGGHSVLESQSFSAVANVSPTCLPYNSRFSGTVDFKINKVYKPDGTLSHFTRQWSIKGLTATAWLGTNASSNTPYKTSSGEQIWFDVVAGTEMFSIKDPVLNGPGTGPAAGAKGTVFIHQGTIVLENRDTHERIVIRHQILRIPGHDGLFRSGWYIQGQKCGS